MSSLLSTNVCFDHICQIQNLKITFYQVIIPAQLGEKSGDFLKS
jgi:hypothetical protein